MARLPQVAPSARPAIPRGVRRLVGPLLLLALWVLLSATGIVSSRSLAPPRQVLSAGVELIRTGELQHHLWVSLQRVVLGLSIGITIGVALALLAGLFRLGEDLVDGPMQVLRGLPVLALVPLMILWLGIGEAPKVTLIVIGVTFPVYLNTFAGIRNVDGRLVESSGTFGLNRRGLIRHVILPGALPSFFTGLRFAFAVSWLVLVVAEQVNATSGIGYLVINAREFLRTDIMLAGLVVYGALGFGSDALVRLFERSALSWRPNFSGT